MITLNSSFHEKLNSWGSAHTTLGTGLASTDHLASLTVTPAAEASPDAR